MWLVKATGDIKATSADRAFANKADKKSDVEKKQIVKKAKIRSSLPTKAPREAAKKNKKAAQEEMKKSQKRRINEIRRILGI